MLRILLLSFCILALTACKKENPCIARAELLCQMGDALAKQQGLDPKEAQERCTQSKKLAEEADEAKQKLCSEDIQNYRKNYEVPSAAPTSTKAPAASQP